MLIGPAELEAIRSGRTDLAFRRWARPRLRVGTRMRTAIGLVEVTSLEVVEVEAITDAEACRAGASSRHELRSRLASHPDRPAYRVGLRFAGADPRIALRERADLTEEEHERLVSALDRLDRASRHGPWTRPTLAVIGRRPGVRAPELALELLREPMAFKRDVRKLKELGLTESLETGYRLAPRAHALLRRSNDDAPAGAPAGGSPMSDQAEPQGPAAPIPCAPTEAVLSNPKRVGSLPGATGEKPIPPAP